MQKCFSRRSFVIMAPVPQLAIGEAARRFRDGSLSPEGLAEDLLARIERENPRLNAYYAIFGKEALEAAARAGREIREGRDRGPLHGIPVAVKDLFDIAGHRTTAGAHPGFHPPPAREDAEVIARLRAAGAVLLGTTALHEWAMGPTTHNPHFGPTRNPHDTTRIPGGSSGGSAAALAAGLCLAALGTDTGGSTRIPASLCGVVGLKPTYGLVSTRGVTPVSRSLDHVGILTASVEDAFLLLEAVSDFRRAAVRRPRVLVPSPPFFDDVPPALRELVREAAAQWGSPETVDLGDAKAAWDANMVILLSDAAAIHENRLKEHPDWFGDDVAERLTRGLEYRGVDYARALDVQRQWTAFLTNLLGDEAVLAVPATPVPAPPIDRSEGAALARMFTRLTAPFNLAGAPVLCVPCGKVDGLPVGLQIVAGPHRESVLWAAWLHGGSPP